MATAAATASKQRPTPLSRALDGHRHARALVVGGNIVAAVIVALVVGIWHSDRVFVVDVSSYAAVAALFVAALAIERLTELLVAPWVGGCDSRMDRNIVVGSFALLIGVVLSGLVGLRLLALFRGDVDVGSGWLADDLAPALDVLATGLAIGAGGKPLHDAIAGLEKNVDKTKSAIAAATSPGTADESGTAASLGRPPSGGAYRISLAVDPAVPVDDLQQTVEELLPGWNVGDGLVHSTTTSVPGSGEYTRQLFSAAHRLHAAGLAVTPLPSPTGAPAALISDEHPPRWALDRIAVDAVLQRDAGGGRGTKVAVLDTGILAHDDGVDPARREQGFDVITSNVGAIDPMLTNPDWLDRDLMGSPGHGTGVAAVIAAGGRDDLPRYSDDWWQHSPMIGVAPEAIIVPYRVMRGPVHLLDDDVAKGVQHARADGCHVISMSLGGFAFRDLADEIDAAIDAGIIVVCAAGNQFGVVVEPANYANTVAVAAVQADGQPFYDGSSRGPEVTVSAPGVKILRPDFLDNDATRPTLSPGTGTTYATAAVSGVAALWLAKHGRDRLLSAYPGRRLPQLFMHLLRKTSTSWSESPGSSPLAVDWGAGIVDARALLDEPVFVDNGDAAVPDALLDTAFTLPPDLAVTARVAGGIASMLASDGSTEIRKQLFGGVFGMWKTLTRRGAPVRPPDAAGRASTLLAAELDAHRGSSPDLRRALAAASTEIPIPAQATPELTLVLEEANRQLAQGTLPDDWGVDELSLPLRRALQGVGGVTHGYRWIGLAALGLSLVAAVLLYSPVAGDPTSEGVTTVAGLGGALGVLAIGVYSGAQAIERLLEFTVGRWAFKNVPGREADRALIMLGTGILIGTAAAVVLRVGMLHEISGSPDFDDTFGSADIFITGLALGGGAKPVHDLLTRIRLGVDKPT